MTAFTYRMGAGSPGDVNRIHPSSIRAFANDASGSNPIVSFGQPAMYHGAANTVRLVDHTDDASLGATTASIAGIAVRPYPFQDSGYGETYGAAAYGVGGPVAGGVVDILTQGSIMVQQNVGLPGTYAAASVLGGKVYVRVTTGTAAFSLAPIGNFEVAADATVTNQFVVSNAIWNGPADQFGVAEITLID